jgi:hypothetical protein
MTANGDLLEVIFAFKVPEELNYGSLGLLEWGTVIDYPGTVAIYICHAMPMKSKQLRQYRKLKRNP